DLLAFVDNRHGVRHVDGVIAIAPRVERIAVAGDAADYALGFGAFGWRQRRQVQICGGADVEHHFGKATRAGDDGNAAAARPARALADREHFRHLVEIVDLNGAVRAQQLREYARLAGEPAGVTDDGALGALGLADLEHDDGLADRGGAIERRDIAFRLADRFGEGADHLGRRIIDHVFQIIDG